MTRRSLNRTLRRAILLLVLVLIISLAAKLADNVPGVAGSPVEKIATQIYDYLKDMALVLITVVAAYLANVFQKRSKFVESLEEEWRGIVRTKSALYAFCEKPYPSSDDYIAAFSRISETIDNMRIVYRNAGETNELIGLYPYAPLHDMRRSLQSLDPRRRQNVSNAERNLVQDAILQCFYALRENFLEELDLEQPTHPLLIYGGRRLRSPAPPTPPDAIRIASAPGRMGTRKSSQFAPTSMPYWIVSITRNTLARSASPLPPPPSAAERLELYPFPLLIAREKPRQGQARDLKQAPLAHARTPSPNFGGDAGDGRAAARDLPSSAFSNAAKATLMRPSIAVR